VTKLVAQAQPGMYRRCSVGSSRPPGFRSTFRDWCGEETHFPREVRELDWRKRSAMRSRRHTAGVPPWTRRELMAAWARYGVGGKVVNFPVEMRSRSAGAHQGKSLPVVKGRRPFRAGPARATVRWRG